jgi:hypothetical protein
MKLCIPVCGGCRFCQMVWLKFGCIVIYLSMPMVRSWCHWVITSPGYDCTHCHKQFSQFLQARCAFWCYLLLELGCLDLKVCVGCQESLMYGKTQHVYILQTIMISLNSKLPPIFWLLVANGVCSDVIVIKIVKVGGSKIVKISIVSKLDFNFYLHIFFLNTQQFGIQPKLKLSIFLFKLWV